VETHSIYYNELRKDTGYKVYKEAIPYLLDLYSEYNIKSTFFITGYIAKLFPDIVKKIDFIPRTGSGKTMRYKLIQNYEEKSI